MKTVIATGIYPPQIGGPAQYAKEMKEAFERKGYSVKVLAYGLENKLPTGIRHGLFFLRSLAAFPGADLILALDTMSVGFPAALAAKLLRKKLIIRTGGDFLWEAYVERTGKKVLLKDFYDTEREHFTMKEKAIFGLTRFTLASASTVAFSTRWQRGIWEAPYRLRLGRTAIVENFYGTVANPSAPIVPASTAFVGFTRPLKWKNLDTLKEAFGEAHKAVPGISLVTDTMPYAQAQEALKGARAAILVSLGDISPNFALDAVRAGTPLILTKENGLGRLEDYARMVDPLDREDIAKAIVELSDDAAWKTWAAKVRSFPFVHTWDEMAAEFVTISKNQ
jgi:hypothetical protein